MSTEPPDPTHLGRRRTGARLAAVVLGAGSLLGVPGAAAAHVTVEPASIDGGGFAVVAVRVPNERDDAATTRVRVILPVEQPLASVQTTPVPGWRTETRQRELEEPLELFGSELTSVVSEVIWTATAGGVQPGQFQDFPVSLGQLPKSGELVFKAVQTYSGGEEVAWNETAVGDSVELEHPAPVLSLTPAADGSGASAAPTSTTLPLALSGAALLVAVGALVMSLRRRA